MELINLSSELNDIIHNLSKVTGMEFAIFDTQSNLISSTELYLKYKGDKVHSDSINEVLTQESVIVNKPGYMKSCIGCRFVNNCPSTIEILSCIKTNNVSIGVINMTSFSKKKHNLIENHIEDYMETLKNASNLISKFTSTEFNEINYSLQNTIVDKIIDVNEKDIIIADENGIIINCSKTIDQFFSICDLYKNSINQILPKSVVNWILNSKTKGIKYVTSKKFTGEIVVNPIIVENKLSGFIITLNPDKNIEIIENNFHHLDNIITKNEEMDNIKNQIKKISHSSSSVLITGETGTGKEMIAKAIHFSSNRKNNPFVPINCTSIPDNLFESEFFGYEEGAFTGAKRGGKIGMFELSNGGTIFLDEIGELPVHLQSKLLRVLQEKTITRLGSITPIPIDVRVISATNKDLEELIYEDRFREDLYYRLKVIPIELPLLSQRIQDIQLLSYYFLEKYNNILNKNISSISKEALKLLKNHSWPGNVRELENTIEYALNMEDSPIITPYNLPSYITANKPQNTNKNNTVLREETNLILSTLNKYGWNVEGKKKTSEELDISLRTLYRRLKKI